MTAKLFKSGQARSLLSAVSRSVELIKADKAKDLIYTVTPFAGGLYATSELDGGTGLTVNPSANLSSLSIPGVRAPYSEADAMLSWFAGTIDEVTAKDASGTKVQLPNKIIRNITVSNASAAEVVAKPKNDSVAFDVYGIRGKKAGTTSVLVSFYPSHSTGLRTATLDNVQVKKDYPVTASLSAGENGKGKTVWLSLLNGLSINSGDETVNGVVRKKQTFGDITLKDLYGAIEFKNYSVYRTMDLFGTQLFVSNVKWTDPANPGTLRIDVDKTLGTAVYVYQPGNAGSRLISFTANVSSGGRRNPSMFIWIRIINRLNRVSPSPCAARGAGRLFVIHLLRWLLKSLPYRFTGLFCRP
ncbi:hypothetical protein LJK87_01525 [Paenibacillus sp. P25]|nr:hypothetical protein LJK87_01525 [Paenibacillus sp. P25]